MNQKQYRQARALVALFVAATVSIAVTQQSNLLAVVAVLTGMLFMLALRSKTEFITDEREKTVREKAANITYAIFTPTIGLGSFFLTTLGQSVPYLFALGQVLSYLTLFIIALYSLSYYFLNRQFGGTDEE